jgi:hypothetical protein
VGCDACELIGGTVLIHPLSALKMEVACFSETVVSVTRLRDVTLGDHTVCINRREALICENSYGLA